MWHKQKQSLPGVNRWPLVLPVNNRTVEEITQNGMSQSAAATQINMEGDKEAFGDNEHEDPSKKG